MAMSPRRFGLVLGGLLVLANVVGCDNGTSANAAATAVGQAQTFVGDFLLQLVAAWLL